MPLASVESLKAALENVGGDTGRILSVPGCWDGLTALLIEQAGFPAAFLTGGGLSMARLGRPDCGLITASELVDATETICSRIDIPLIVDGDTGFGNALTLQRTIRQVEKAGASAIQIEDQSFPKRCGHMKGKNVVGLDEATGRIKAALDARNQMLVIARTDALAIEGVDRAIDRAEAFADAGADLIFIEGPKTMGEVQKIAARFSRRLPLVHNLVEGGISPSCEGKDYARHGYAMALHPLLLMHSMVHCAPRLLGHLASQQSTSGLTQELANLARMNEVTGAKELLHTGDSFE